jgi:peptidoglycan-associated lipoprotein
MLTNNKFRTLILAAAATSIMACSSPSDEKVDDAEANNAAADAAAAKKAEEDRIAREEARVQKAAADRMENAEQMMRAEKANLVSMQTVYFDFDRSTIKAEFRSVLDKHAEFLVKNRGQQIVIEGHTDSRGTPEYNIALGERRANAVRTYLMNEGVSASQMSVVSYGEEKPAVMGATDYAMAQNRRGVLVYN